MNTLTKISITLFAICLAACVDREPASQSTPAPIGVDVGETVITAGKLSGLHMNAGRGSPIILIIPGSGPTDLNGNNSFIIRSNSYQQLAAGLADKGISTVRVDKRGLFSSADAGNPNAVTVDIYAKDYSLWVETIIAKTGADCVYVLGHSEGALMASAAANINPNVCGQILVAGVGRSFGEVLREQFRGISEEEVPVDNALAAVGKLERGKYIPAEELDLLSRQIFPPQVQGFLISLMQADPAELAKTADARTLIIHGETDIQTSVVNAEELAAATGGTLVIIPGVNHVLKQAPKNQGENIKTYSQPDLPISTEVVDAIADFVGE